MILLQASIMFAALTVTVGYVNAVISLFAQNVKANPPDVAQGLLMSFLWAAFFFVELILAVPNENMRNLKSYNQPDAEQELRADEFLIPAGGVDGYNFFAAGSEEDFCRSKEEKLLLRKQKRKEKSERIS